MPTYDLATAQQDWRDIPVDDHGYLNARDLDRLTDEALVALIDRMEQVRYSPNGWRNWNSGWCRGMHHGLTGRRVLDFGCGVGLEARTLARQGNQLIVADINPASVRVASRVLKLDGHRSDSRLIGEHAPFVGRATFDVFYSNGVLHHIPWAGDVLAWAAGRLPADGEMRLLLYTDRARDRCADLGVSMGDGMDHGGYATWYDEPKLASILPAGWRVEQWEYMTREGLYATARVVRS